MSRYPQHQWIFFSTDYCFSSFRRVIAFACADLCASGDAAHFDADGAKATVARLVRRIIAEAVLRADLCGDLRKGRARIAQIGGHEITASRSARQIVHLAAGQVVQVAADLHALERAEATEALVIRGVGARHEDSAIALELCAR